MNTPGAELTVIATDPQPYDVLTGDGTQAANTPQELNVIKRAIKPH